MEHILSISTIAYDGYDFAAICDEIAAIGARYVEPIFIQGYTGEVEEDSFSEAAAQEMKKRMSGAGLSCYAFSSHMDLSAPGVVDVFTGRMVFAKTLGARIIVSNAAPVLRKKEFMANMDKLVKTAASLGLVIALENPGDGRESVVNGGRSGAEVIRQLDSEWVKLNYDFGNVMSHFSGMIRPEEDFLPAIPYAVHYHLKDVKAFEDGWQHTEIGKGSIDYRKVITTLVERCPHLHVSLEIPLRLTRTRDASPRRYDAPLPISVIRSVVKSSFEYVKNSLMR